MIPGCSRNWRRTSCTTVPAERPTARMARAENMKAIDPPISRPMNVLGSATLIWVAMSWNRAEPVLPALSSLPMVSMKLANNATAAMTADPIAKPFVTAFVVLPTASRLTMIRSGSPSNSPDISAMPAALSATGPNVSSDTTTPVVASMPMPVSATRYSENWILPPPSAIAVASAPQIATIAHTDDSSPLLTPASTAVAGPPVAADSAISCTGLVSVDVKYSVMRDAICASTRPATTAPNIRQPTFDNRTSGPSGFFTYTSASTSVPTIVRMPAVRKPRLIGAIADLSFSFARTENTPTIDASTPSARAASGNRAPIAHSSGRWGKLTWNAGTP